MGYKVIEKNGELRFLETDKGKRVGETPHQAMDLYRTWAQRKKIACDARALHLGYMLDAADAWMERWEDSIA